MNESSQSIKRVLIGLFVLIVILAAGFIASYLIVGTKEVTMAPAPPLYGQIAQRYINGTGKNIVTNVNNYTLINPTYFNKSTWAVAQFIPKNNDGDNSSVVMQKVGPFYEVVLGPGAAFPSNLQPGLPADVYQYLYSKGMIYEYN